MVALAAAALALAATTLQPNPPHTSDGVVEQIIRPTGLVDPLVTVKPTEGQIDDLLEQVRARVEKDERVLVTTLTKKMAEELTTYLAERGVRVEYLHSDVDTLRRVELLRELRKGAFDVLVGINLLREGLDIPEVALVAILDADKEGFLRSERSLIQTIGRAARNSKGRVILYADKQTDSIRSTLEETDRRRAKQEAYNVEHGITPKTIEKKITSLQDSIWERDYVTVPRNEEKAEPGLPQHELGPLVEQLRSEMREAARELEFERAAELRDRIKALEAERIRLT